MSIVYRYLETVADVTTNSDGSEPKLGRAHPSFFWKLSHQIKMIFFVCVFAESYNFLMNENFNERSF